MKRLYYINHGYEQETSLLNQFKAEPDSIAWKPTGYGRFKLVFEFDFYSDSHIITKITTNTCLIDDLNDIASGNEPVHSENPLNDIIDIFLDDVQTFTEEFLSEIN